ncbi:hypothetical protein HanXRQr2_Chr08g0328731 [Helianthus annuus]|uniref:Uncharacterized protein n=1 Tax=Helianthus annuus TaxID=4232 RepID=A0A9K3NBN4_HELAN|nr:hypothetical protein HanXRQr2_Chr08g0328731 [Helianthus annuus]KAJ0900793.1 hypothetical protein HanPSC8_Chr08g0317791 [Helianthus annuus]
MIVGPPLIGNTPPECHSGQALHFIMNETTNRENYRVPLVH